MKKYIVSFIKVILYLITFFLIYKFTLSEIKMDPGKGILVMEFMSKSPIILKQILMYFSLALFLHIFPYFIISKASKEVSSRFTLSPILHLSYFSFSLIAMWGAVLAFNYIEFPMSKFSFPLLPELAKNHVDWFAYGSLSIFSIFVFIPVGIILVKKIVTNTVFKFGITVIILSLIVTAIIPNYSVSATEKTKKPNIILIGLDSIAPIHLEHNPKRLSYLKKQLASGMNFPHSITPLARTFPSWSSILSGKYPVHTGARFNLTQLGKINKQSGLLGKILKKSGYQTIYAQDERKFNNLNETFGFDKVVGPAIGASEFILTHLSDLPMINMALLVPGSHYLFPSIAYNRADEIHYSPSEFVSKLLDEIPSNNNKPLFLATHLCLSHYPYKWRNYSGSGSGNTFESAQQQSMIELELQLKTLITGLEKKGLLDNALLVLLSDHGESLNYNDGMWLDRNKGDQIYIPDSELHPPIIIDSNFSGHGTNILAKSQYSTLLSFKGFGSLKDVFKPSKNQQLVSLIDIMPTILSSLKIAIPADLDGKSLLIDNKELDSRFFITETGLAFSSLKSVKDFSEDELLEESKKYYTVENGTGLLILKSETYPDLIKKKSYAIHNKNWILSFHRKLNMPPVVALVHKTSGEWTIGSNKELIKQAPIKLMLNKFIRNYGDEVKDFSKTWVYDQ